MKRQAEEKSRGGTIRTSNIADKKDFISRYGPLILKESREKSRPLS
jgi:hypothetical protein